MTLKFVGPSGSPREPIMPEIFSGGERRVVRIHGPRELADRDGLLEIRVVGPFDGITNGVFFEHPRERRRINGGGSILRGPVAPLIGERSAVRVLGGGKRRQRDDKNENTR